MNLPIRVILPGPPADTLECRLLDVSATGMRIESDVTLVLNELVAIEVEDQLVLGEIRHCHPEGDKFIGGVRRLHQVAKRLQLGDIGTYVSQMIEDLERRVMAGEEHASRMLALEALDRLVEKAQADRAEQSQVETAPAGPIKLPALTGPPPEEKKERPKSWKIPFAAAAALVLAAGVIYGVYEKRMNATPPVPVVAARSTPAPVVPKIEPTPTPVAKAEPVQTAVAKAPAAPVKPAVVPAATPVAAVKPQPAPAKPAPAAVAGMHHARITLVAPSWVSVAPDGKPLGGKVMQKGEVQDFDFSEKALLHIGYGAGVEISVDGKSVGPIGGALRMIELTAAGKRFLPWQNEAPAAAGH